MVGSIPLTGYAVLFLCLYFFIITLRRLQACSRSVLRFFNLGFVEKLEAFYNCRRYLLRERPIRFLDRSPGVR